MLCAAGGCAGPLAASEAEFRRGDYPAAKDDLAAAEVRARAWAAPERAEYALYRGLTLAALGDVLHGLGWLEQARAAEERRPGLLSAEDARRLETALDALGPVVVEGQLR
jgi:hypothetical protein